MAEYKYCVVIPHYNSPKLLSRMLKSVPEREDIQIIVVDDCSSKEAQEELTCLQHCGLEVVLQEENHGAGAARNVGLERVKGKWVIVVDSDDEFKPDAFDVFDHEIDDETDYLCFLSDPLDENTGLPTKEFVPANYAVEGYLKNQTRKSYNYFKYRNMVCWNKLVASSYIKKHDIRFEECEVNNDVFYALQVCYYSDRFKVLPNRLYTYYINDKSITHSKRSIEKEFQFYLQAQKRNGYCKSLGLTHYPFYRSTWLYIPFIVKKRGFVDAFRFFVHCYKNINVIKAARKQYLSILSKQ